MQIISSILPSKTKSTHQTILWKPANQPKTIKMYKFVAALVLLALAAVASAGVLVPQAYSGATSYSYNVPTAPVGFAAPVAAYGLGYAAAPAIIG